MDSPFERAWRVGITEVLLAYDTAYKCNVQIDACLMDLGDISLTKRWRALNWYDQDTIQQFLTDSRSALNSAKYSCNIAAKKLLLIERIMYVSVETKQKEKKTEDEEEMWYVYISTSIERNKTQYPDSFNEWEHIKEKINALNPIHYPKNNFLIWFINSCISRGDTSLQNIVKRIEADERIIEEFRTRRDIGIGPVIKTDEHAQKMRLGIMQMGFDTLTTVTKPVGAAVRESITQSIHSALVKLADN